MKFLSIATLALVVAMMTGCSGDDDSIGGNTQQPEEQGNIVTLTTTVSMAGGDATRALSPDGKKTFAVGDKIAVIYRNTNGETKKAESEALTVDNITDEGKSASFTVTLESPNKSRNVTYIYPAAMAKDDGSENYDALAMQDGTLTSLGNTLDLCTNSGPWDGDKLPVLTLVNQLAICAYTLKNESGADEITGDITGMTISDGTNNYVVTRSAAVGPIYVAIRPVSETNIEITANSGSKYYTKKLGLKTYDSGNGYSISLRMNESTTVDLSKIYTDFTVQNDHTLTGTLAANVKISVADGSTVTLNNVTINGVDSEDCKWAGISCLGDVTIVLADGSTNNVKGFHNRYPGLTVNKDKTLTIQGTGSLNAASNGLSSAIGSGNDQYTPCGNIVIKSGNIVATGGEGSAGIGGGYPGLAECGTISITGGNVTAIGGSNAPGIGSAWNDDQFFNYVGDITISGGTVNAIGNGGAAAIGCGYNGKCLDITITDGVTRVMAKKGGSANYCIGRGKDYTDDRRSYCRDVTIGGKNMNNKIRRSPYCYVPYAIFSVSDTKLVYFSHGNLQYIGSAETPYWKFADEQYSMIGNGQLTEGANVDRDLFGWGTSGSDGKNPWMVSRTDDYYSGDADIAGTNYDWGVNNTISNDTHTGWRTMTKDEWNYLVNSRPTTSGVRFAKATVMGTKGLLILPDHWDSNYYSLRNVNKTTGDASYTDNNITDQYVWIALNDFGVVFLPACGYRDGTEIKQPDNGQYWTSSYSPTTLSTKQAWPFIFGPSQYAFFYESDRYEGSMVRLVRDASIISPTYNNGSLSDLPDYTGGVDPFNF